MILLETPASPPEISEKAVAAPTIDPSRSIIMGELPLRAVSPLAADAAGPETLPSTPTLCHLMATQLINQLHKCSSFREPEDDRK